MALRGITLAFIALLLAVLMPTSILLYSMENTMLKPQFWVMELDKMHAYDTLKASVSENLGAKTSVLPDTWMKEQAQSLIGNILGYVTGEKPALNLTINTKSLKDTGRQELYTQAEAEVNKWAEAMGYTPDNPYTGTAKQQKLKEIKDAIDTQLNALPENADLAQFMDKKTVDQTRGYVATGLALTKALQVASILLLLIGLAIAGSLHGAARWVAPIFIVTGASLLLLVIIVPPALEKATAQANAPEPVKQLVTDMFADIMAKTTPEGIVLSATGILLFFFGRTGKQEEAKPEEKGTEETETKPEEKKKPEEKPAKKTSRKKAK